MFLFGSAEYADVISDADASLKTLENLVDALLEDVLADVESKWKPLEAVSSEWCAERCQQLRLLFQGHAPVSAFGVQFAEHLAASE